MGMRNATRQPRFGPLTSDQATALADGDAVVGMGVVSMGVTGTGVVGENLNMATGVGEEGVGIAGVEDGMESLQANDDFARSSSGCTQ
jgi:hypothetical protein